MATWMERDIIIPVVAMFHVMSESPFFKYELAKKLEMYNKLEHGTEIGAIMGKLWDAMYEEEQAPSPYKTFRR
jgi:hypothetical protein